MTTSRYPAITDELLSAYIDGAVTGTERIAIEQAVIDDPDVAWRLTTLQETVSLLRSLPVVQAPRSFVLTAQQVSRVSPENTRPADVALEKPAPHRGRVAEAGAWGRFVEGWRRFWQGGNPALRNAMAASMAALLLLLIVPSLLSTPAALPGAQTQQAPASEFLAGALNEGELSPKAETQSSEPVLESFSTDLPPEAPGAESAAAPVAEDAVIVELAVPEPSDRQGVASRAAASPPADDTEAPSLAMAAPAAEEVLAAAPAANARTLEGAPAAAAGAMTQPRATADALAFAPSAANAAAGPAAQSMEAGPAMAAAEAAPVGEFQPEVAEAALPATEIAADALPATESAADASLMPVEQPALAEVVATPADAAAEQPAGPTVIAATEPAVTADSSTPILDSSQARLAPEAASNAATGWPAALTGQIFGLFQLTAGAAALLFGLLWWRSRRTV